MQINDRYLVECLSINNYGKGVCKVEEIVVFVDDFYPEEKALIIITKTDKKFAFAKIVNLVTSSIHRIKPLCQHSIEAGTCIYNDIDIDYEEELKSAMVRSNIERSTKVKLDKIEVIKSPIIEGYRNKVTVFFKEENKEYFFGYFKEKSHDLVRVDSCVQIHEDILKVIKELLQQLKINSIPIYDYKKKEGIARGVSIRRSDKYQEMSVMIISNDNHRKYLNVQNTLHEKFPLISSLSLNINNSDNTIIYTGNEYQLFGKDLLREEVLGLNFEVKNRNFLQINTKASELLYKEALRMASLENKDVVLDLYSGCGGISLVASKYAKYVYGIETSRDSVKMAISNRNLNNISNVSFYDGDATRYKEILKGKKIDKLFLDPPREGLAPKLIETIIKDQVKTVVYISCDSYTLARDLKLFVDKGYDIKEVKCVNMFPRTIHIETVCALRLKEH